MMTESRMKDEFYALSQAFSPKQFRLTSSTLTIALQTNSKKVYTVKLELGSNYPYSLPTAHITSPKPLKDRNNRPMLDASHSMHTLPSIDGCTRICHYGPSQWHPGVYLYQIVIKIRVWLEVYETHLKTGAPLDKYLASAQG